MKSRFHYAALMKDADMARPDVSLSDDEEVSNCQYFTLHFAISSLTRRGQKLDIKIVAHLVCCIIPNRLRTGNIVQQ